MLMGWILAGIAGALISSTLLYFWDDIRKWLNTYAADLVGRYLGYDARNGMLRAVVKIDRFMNQIRKRTTFVTESDQYIDEVEIETMLAPYEISPSVLEELAQSSVIKQEYDYREG